MSTDTPSDDGDTDASSPGRDIPVHDEDALNGRSGSSPRQPSIINKREAGIARGQALAIAHSIKNGVEPPDLTDEQALSLNSLSSSPPGDRMSVAYSRYRRNRYDGHFGTSHDGRRNYHETFGYPEFHEVQAEDYQEYAQGQGPGYTLTYRPVNASWRHAPRIHDDGRDEESDPSQFEQDVQTLFDGLEHGKGLPFYWEWADRKQRPNQYGLLFFGFDDGREMHRPVDTEQLSGPEDLQYCNTFSQADVAEWTVAGELDEDETNNDGDDVRAGAVRPDQPVLYEIEFDIPTADGDTTTDTRTVHWTRIVHIVETPTTSEWIGEECLRPHLHRLIDYEKVVGSTAEAYYAAVDRKYIGSSSSDSDETNGVGGGSGISQEEVEEFDRQMREMTDDMRTTAFAENMDIEVISGDTVDPSGPIAALYQAFAGPSGIPQRVMTGSERGDLASSQDRFTFFEGIDERRNQFNEPEEVRPSLDRFIEYGIVAEPENEDNEYTVIWPDLFSLTDLEKAQLQERRSSALVGVENAISMGADRDRAYDHVGIQLPDKPTAEVGSGDTIGVGANTTSHLYSNEAYPATDPLTTSNSLSLNATYSEGDVVEYDVDGHIGVVDVVLTDDFTVPVGDEDEKEVTVDEDETYYIVLREPGGFGHYEESDLSPGSFPDDVPGEVDDIEDADLASNNHESLSINEKPWLGFKPGEPEGWNRLSYLRAYASLGGSWTSVRNRMRGRVRDPEGFASALKDQVWGTTRWRNRW